MLTTSQGNLNLTYIFTKQKHEYLPDSFHWSEESAPLLQHTWWLKYVERIVFQ